MGRYKCPLCGTEYDTETEHDINHSSSHTGAKGGNKSLGNKTADLLDDVKNESGKMWRDITDDLSE